jgi:hypothetical protein
MKFTIVLAHFVRMNQSAAKEGWYPEPIPRTKTNIEIWDTDEGPGKMVWDGYLQMNQANPPELNLDNFRTALNRFLMFIQGEGRDNYQRVFTIVPSP